MNFGRIDLKNCVQPSLSLDNTVEVFVLRNEGEFVSVDQGQKMGSNATIGEKKKKREENMRQLLDVTNTITSEEMQDFEMRYPIQSKIYIKWISIATSGRKGRDHKWKMIPIDVMK